MTFEESIIWQNSGILNHYEQMSSGIVTQSKIVLTPPNAIKCTLNPPIKPPTAVSLEKWFPIKDDIWFSQWRYLPSSNLPLQWLSLLKMWEAWRDSDNHRNNHQITIGVNEDLELSGRGFFEIPKKHVSRKTFDWWVSDLDVPLDEWFRLMVHIRKHESSGLVEWFLDDDEIFSEDGIQTHFPDATQFYSTTQTYYSTGPERNKPIVTYVDETVAAREYVPFDYRVIKEEPPIPPEPEEPELPIIIPPPIQKCWWM